MRFPVLSYAVAGAALAFGTVAAAPLKIIVVSSSVQSFDGSPSHGGLDGLLPFRFGHAAADAVPPALASPHIVHFQGSSATLPTGRKQRLCSQMRKMKGAVMNAFGLGGDAKQEEQMFHALPIVITPSSDKEKMQDEQHDGHRARPTHRHRCSKGSFLRRIHVALSSLGTWEGRAVAFVLGCGLGVLLRMVFILTVLFVRAIRSRGENEDDEAPEVLYIALPIEEHIQEAPPTYTDEKAECAVEIKV